VLLKRWEGSGPIKILVIFKVSHHHSLFSVSLALRKKYQEGVSFCLMVIIDYSKSNFMTASLVRRETKGYYFLSELRSRNKDILFMKSILENNLVILWHK